MKVELKKIEHSPSLSEETEAFTANIYINGVKAGIASNAGRGGNTDYRAIDEDGKTLIKEAEEYYKGLPPTPSPFDPKTLDRKTLEDVIDALLYKHLNDRELLKFNRKLESEMPYRVVFGVPGERFTSVAFKITIPIASLLAQPSGVERLKDIIKGVIPDLTNGNIVLNTNIPEYILKDAGLKEHQYVKQPIPLPSKRHTKLKKPRRKL